MSEEQYNAIYQRMQDVGLHLSEIDTIPIEEIGKVASGINMLVVIRKPEICPCCNRPVHLAICAPSTKTPLEELFK